MLQAVLLLSDGDFESLIRHLEGNSDGRACDKWIYDQGFDRTSLLAVMRGMGRSRPNIPPPSQAGVPIAAVLLVIGLMLLAFWQGWLNPVIVEFKTFLNTTKTAQVIATPVPAIPTQAAALPQVFSPCNIPSSTECAVESALNRRGKTWNDIDGLDGSNTGNPLGPMVHKYFMDNGRDTTALDNYLKELFKPKVVAPPAPRETPTAIILPPMTLNGDEANRDLPLQ